MAEKTSWEEGKNRYKIRRWDMRWHVFLNIVFITDFVIQYSHLLTAKSLYTSGALKRTGSDILLSSWMSCLSSTESGSSWWRDSNLPYCKPQELAYVLVIKGAIVWQLFNTDQLVIIIRGVARLLISVRTDDVSGIWLIPLPPPPPPDYAPLTNRRRPLLVRQ